MAAVLLWMGVALDVGMLVGLAVRGRWRDSWICPLVISAALASALTVGLCPACNTWTFWLLQEFGHIALLLLLGVELSLRLCPLDTPARRHMRAWIAVVLVIAVGLVIGAAGIDALPRLIAAVIFLYTGLTLVMVAHGLKISLALHEALLYGFPPYLLVYVTTWGYTREDTTWAGLLSPLAFNLMMLNLLRVAWRHDPTVGLPRRLLARVGRHLD